MDEATKHKRNTALVPVSGDNEVHSAEKSSRSGERAQQRASSQYDNADISAVADLGYN